MITPLAIAILRSRLPRKGCYIPTSPNQEYERTCLEVELQQLREELTQQQPCSHRLPPHGHHPSHHAPLPPVLPLSGRRLLPDADHEIGFGAADVRHALYDMGEELKRQVGRNGERWGRVAALRPASHRYV